MTGTRPSRSWGTFRLGIARNGLGQKVAAGQCRLEALDRAFHKQQQHVREELDKVAQQRQQGAGELRRPADGGNSRHERVAAAGHQMTEQQLAAVDKPKRAAPNNKQEQTAPVLRNDHLLDEGGGAAQWQMSKKPSKEVVTVEDEFTSAVQPPTTLLLERKGEIRGQLCRRRPL